MNTISASLRPALRTTTLVLSALLALLMLGGVAAASTQAPAEQQFADEINRERAARGQQPLVVDAQIASVARAWSDAMANQNSLHHNPQFAEQITGGWQRVGENVGTASGGSLDVLVPLLHRSFMESAGHRDNLLGNYNRMGVGVTVTGTGSVWVTVNFALFPGAPAPSPTPPPAPPSTATMDEAIAISSHEFVTDSAGYAVLARNDVFADALAGAALAGRVGPVLYTTGPTPQNRNPGLYGATRTELARVLRPGSTVYVLGGTGAMSEQTAGDLEAAGYDVHRLAGGSRIETALRIAEEVRRLHGGSVDEVIIARADAWPDAVTGGAYAASTGTPLLLTPNGELDAGVAAFLAATHPERTFALGGRAALTDSVVAAAGARRIAGADRMSTAVAIAEQLWGRRTATAGDDFVVASAWDTDGWAAALAYAPVSARHGSPQLLVGDDVPGSVADYLSRSGYGSRTPGELQTTSGVPAGVASQLRQLIAG
jgi:uncharacterized protein YkwD